MRNTTGSKAASAAEKAERRPQGTNSPKAVSHLLILRLYFSQS